MSFKRVFINIGYIMKQLLLILTAAFTFATSYSQNKDQLNILDNFIIAHNDGSEKAIKQFIKNSYLPEIYDNINLKDHIAFYKQIVTEFGDLNHQIYYIVEETPHKVIVHLTKKNRAINNQNINPEDILQVEIYLSKENAKYMQNGLGLGSLFGDEEREQ